MKSPYQWSGIGSSIVTSSINAGNLLFDEMDIDEGASCGGACGGASDDCSFVPGDVMKRNPVAFVNCRHANPAFQAECRNFFGLIRDEVIDLMSNVFEIYKGYCISGSDDFPIPVFSTDIICRLSMCWGGNPDGDQVLKSAAFVGDSIWNGILKSCCIEMYRSVTGTITFCGRHANATVGGMAGLLTEVLNGLTRNLNQARFLEYLVCNNTGYSRAGGSNVDLHNMGTVVEALVISISESSGQVGAFDHESAFPLVFEYIHWCNKFMSPRDFWPNGTHLWMLNGRR